jgi:uncharacterized caspase-like protein
MFPKRWYPLSMTTAICAALFVSALSALARTGQVETREFQSRQARGQRWALLVGIDKYDSPRISPLRFSVTDVQAVAETLTKDAGFPEENVIVLTSDRTAEGRPTNTNILRRFRYLAEKIGPNDTFLFYFSGHGFSFEEGKHFLASVNADNADMESLEKTAISLKELQDRMKNIRALQTIFIIDACRNDPSAGGRGDKDNVMTVGFARDLQLVAKSTGNEIAGTALFMACSAGERAWEWDEKGHGVFTYYLLEGLKGRAKDNTGRVTMPDLAEYVQKSVVRWSEQNLDATQKRQKPDLIQSGAAKVVLAEKVDGGTTDTGGTTQIISTIAELKITSSPAGAKVFVDEQEIAGKTPITYKIDLGREKTRNIEVVVEAEGYKAQPYKVTLQRGKQTPLDVTLVKLEPGPDPNPPPDPSVGGAMLQPIRRFNAGDVARFQAVMKATVQGLPMQMTLTTRQEVQEVRPNGDVVFVVHSEGGRGILAGMEQDIPPSPPVKETYDRYGRLQDYQTSTNEDSFFSPEIEQALAMLGEVMLPPKAVKSGESWENRVRNPAAPGKSITVRGTFLGLEESDGMKLWKVRQAAEMDTDEFGSLKMQITFTAWLNPANGQFMKVTGTVKNLPTQLGPIEMNMQVNRVVGGDNFEARPPQKP